MAYVVIGTAGHVDHGKTMLVKALTGIDTDRLKEEKERGISIELGFASLLLPDGKRAGIVDVPGHEKFVKHMLAGTGGIDLVLLVIAADEGVMPQTREHMDIIQLLQVKHGVIALNKIDLVDEEWLALVREEVREFLASTGLKDAPLVEVSAVTGKGLAELRSALNQAAVFCRQEKKSVDYGKVRLPIDRVFSVAGFGTVVTGTLWSGLISPGDNLTIMPPEIPVRVRGLQVHGESVAAAKAGQRVAVNLSGVEKSDIVRGHVLASPKVFFPSNRFDARLFLLPHANKALKHRARVRLYLGTAEVLGRVRLLDREELHPGETAYIQMELEEIMVALKNDRFIIRSYSPILTIGGGTVIDPGSPRHKRRRPEILQMLELKDHGTPEEIVMSYLIKQAALLTLKELSTPKEIIFALTAAGKIKVITGDNQEYFVVTIIYHSWVEKIKAHLQFFHRQYPLREGCPREDLRARFFSSFSPRLFQFLLRTMAQENIIKLSGQAVALAGFIPQLAGEQQKIVRQIENIYQERACQPPSWPELVKQMGMNENQAQELREFLFRQGTLIKITDELYFHGVVFNQIKKLIKNYLQEKKEISISEARDLLNTSRKYVLPLFEYLDREHLTLRVGDKRVAGRLMER
ncbi:MAG: selenocysteine-specific translation elongation factor [Peptococcaceae bacterium]